MNQDALTAKYYTERRNALKRMATQIRQDAGLSQETVAELLGCTKERVTSVEDVNNRTEYSLAEMELLALFCGKHPTDLVRMSQDDALHLATIMTENQTGSALLNVVDCTLPARLKTELSETDSSPDPVIFSLDGERIACIVDVFLDDDWWDQQEGERPHLTIVCWNTRTGKVIRQKRVQHLEHIAFLDNEHIVLAHAVPTRQIEDGRDFEGNYHLSVWNLHTNEIEQTIPLLDRVGNLAVNPDSRYLAAFFPTTLTVQCWTLSDWQPCRAYEFEPPAGGDLDALGMTYRITTEVSALPRARKWTNWIDNYRASRFAFANWQQLVLTVGKRMIELDLETEEGTARSLIEHPVTPWNPITHDRNEMREIAITKIDYQHETGESQVEIWYVIPRGRASPLEASVRITRRYTGGVFAPKIRDDACILALVDYQTPYPWGELYQYGTRMAVCNLLSDRMVLLSDAGRLQERETFVWAGFSPRGDAIAYWISGDGIVPRLSIQYIALAPLRAEGVSLSETLERNRGAHLQ